MEDGLMCHFDAGGGVNRIIRCRQQGRDFGRTLEGITLWF
jgi:hypothetical protein